MPKKYKKYAAVKPINTAHPSLETSSSSNHHHRHGGGNSSSTSSPAPQERSVNDLIEHLRRTHVTSPDPGDRSPNSSRALAPRTVHPSIRNILELPETPPPRPRPNARPSILGRRLRRTPGPPPPSSWLEGSSLQSGGRSVERNGIAVGSGQVLFRLERLPGASFPAKRSLQHAVLMSMALHWIWHLDYDGAFLSELPNRMKMLLLSYIAVYSTGTDVRSRMHGLSSLFTSSQEEYQSIMVEPDITRLDLSSALGRWMSLNLLRNQLLTSTNQKRASQNSALTETSVPTSWDDTEGEGSDVETSSLPSSPLTKSLTQKLRFENLRYLSLAHPDPASASWLSLVNFLSHVSTLTHLSLAHWPIPTLTPNSIHARVQHSTIRTLTFAAGGTDTYSAFENNWTEATRVLRRLSRATYCLKWLDLEGCGEWFGALSWDGMSADGEQLDHSPWLEWNGAWRDIEWIGLGVGWLPSAMKSSSSDEDLSGAVPTIPLTASVHAQSDLPWNVEEERIEYRRRKEMEAYEGTLRKARDVERRIHRIRREHGGKWIHFSFGGNGEQERRVLDEVLERVDKRERSGR